MDVYRPMRDEDVAILRARAARNHITPEEQAARNIMRQFRKRLRNAIPPQLLEGRK